MSIPEAKVIGYSYIKDNTMMTNVETCPVVIGRPCIYTELQGEPAGDNNDEEDDSGINFKLFILLFLCCPCHVLFPPFYVRE